MIKQLNSTIGSSKLFGQIAGDHEIDPISRFEGIYNIFLRFFEFLLSKSIGKVFIVFDDILMRFVYVFNHDNNNIGYNNDSFLNC